VAGEVISLSGAVPDSGWEISGWSGTDNDASTASTNSLTMPASAHTASVIYTPGEYTLTVTTAGSGSVDKDPDQSTYQYGDVVTLTANADTDWTFSAWSGDVISTDNPVQITIEGDTEITATFTSTVGILGDVNNDGVVNSTDALIVLSADVGMDTSGFCPMNCGDVNGDGVVNSTDALVILAYDAGMDVPYPVGVAGSGCPSSVTQPSGCSP
jgi:hypothetical protein